MLRKEETVDDDDKEKIKETQDEPKANRVSARNAGN